MFHFVRLVDQKKKVKATPNISVKYFNAKLNTTVVQISSNVQDIIRNADLLCSHIIESRNP